MGAAFFVPIVFGWRLRDALFYYLAFATFVSFQTQFTLAYQNRKKELRDELMLRNLVDTMRLLVAMSEKQEDQLDEIHDAADKAAAGAMARAAVITARAAAAAQAAYVAALELGVESDLPLQAKVAGKDTLNADR